MKLLNMKCPNCGARLTLDKATGECTCGSCGGIFLLDDEDTTAKIDFDAENAGYEFEKGRQKAQAEARSTTRTAYTSAPVTVRYAKPKNNQIWLWILGWLCFFPIPLTILICRSKSLSDKAKIAILGILWGFVLICGMISSCEKKAQESAASAPAASEVTAETSVTDMEELQTEESSDAAA